MVTVIALHVLSYRQAKEYWCFCLFFFPYKHVMGIQQKLLIKTLLMITFGSFFRYCNTPSWGLPAVGWFCREIKIIFIPLIWSYAIITLNNLNYSLGKFSRQQTGDILIFQENRFWHFMQIVSNRDNLHETSNPVFLGTISKRFSLYFTHTKL